MAHSLIFILALITFPIFSFAEGQTKIGIAAAVNGSVQAGTGNNLRTLQSGMDIFLNERVRTNNNGSLQILLLDETVFKLGPKSDMIMDEFVYDPSNNNGKISANITKGVFRFITGKIARKNPKEMNVQLAVGSIGVRGTIVAGTTGASGSTIILAGPGVQNNAGENPGAILVSGTEGASSQMINTTGMGVNIGQNGSVSEPKNMSGELAQINAVLNNTSASNIADNTNTDEQSLNEQSGQNTADAKENAQGNIEGNNVDNLASLSVVNNQENINRDTLAAGQLLSIADLPKVGVWRASYATDSTISGRNSSGNVINRGIKLSTIINFADKALQNLNLQIYNPNDGQIYLSDTQNYHDFSNIPDRENKISVNKNALMETDQYLNYDSYALELGIYGNPNSYPNVNADISFFDGGNEVMSGSYNLASSAYNGPITISAMSAIALNTPQANYHIRGLLNPKLVTSGATQAYNYISADFLGSVNFHSSAISDIIIKLKPNTSAGQDQASYYYSNQSFSFTPPTTSSEGYIETNKISIQSTLSVATEKNNFYKDDISGNLYITNENQPTLVLDGLTVSYDGYDYTNTLSGIPSNDFSNPLTHSQFYSIASNLVSAGKPMASYSINGLRLYQDTTNYAPASDDYFANFMTTVDFANLSLIDTEISFKRKDGGDNFTSQYRQNVDIAIEEEISGNHNSKATAELNLSNLEEVAGNDFNLLEGVLTFENNNGAAPNAFLSLSIEDNLTGNTFSSKDTALNTIRKNEKMSKIFAHISGITIAETLPAIKHMQAQYHATGNFSLGEGYENLQGYLNTKVNFLDGKFTDMTAGINSSYGEKLVEYTPTIAPQISINHVHSRAINVVLENKTVYTSNTELQNKFTDSMEADIGFNYSNDNIDVPSISVVLSMLNTSGDILGEGTLTANASNLQDTTLPLSQEALDNWKGTYTGDTATYYWTEAYTLNTTNCKVSSANLQINFANNSLSGSYGLIQNSSPTGVTANFSNLDISGPTLSTALTVSAPNYSSGSLNLQFVNSLTDTKPNVLADISIIANDPSANLGATILHAGDMHQI